MRRQVAVIVLALSATIAGLGQDEQEYMGWMKTIGATAGSLRKNIAAKSADAVKDAKTLEEAFGKVHKFWMQRKVDDAMKFSMDAQSGFRDVAAKAAAGDFDGADAAVKAASTTCAGCHKVHREKVENGWKIK